LKPTRLFQTTWGSAAGAGACSGIARFAFLRPSPTISCKNSPCRDDFINSVSYGVLGFWGAIGNAFGSTRSVTYCYHNDYISSLRSPSFAIQVVKGYAAMLRVITEAGHNIRQAWRFALFFVFPFLLMAVLP